MKISIEDYFMDHRERYPLALGPDIEREAARTVGLANQLLDQAATFGVVLHQLHPEHKSLVSSGWRPPAYNATVPRAAPNSKHMTGCAIDLYDPDGELDDWLVGGEGQAALVALGLWMEHPSATKGWAHLQTLPPKSRKRVFYP
ncbi:hypothetical protein LNV23_18910 [Paucibacter sp. DJ1R-11]|uniref:hypothetical protein n=1 Tax=Paucibacter sp. DJ1R-11 TaxID=2893556 RepID=UPI0021E3FBB5|nr:hypothetical protein [Paucibacter sp. DJ1R-11]MCV2365524.1 hypothetical protein [Paucibacter sp. DJ1R-11]